MKQLFIVAGLIGSFLNVPKIHAQGCSDAGFCTAGALKPLQEIDSSFRHQFKLTAAYGIGEQGTLVLQAISEAELSFFKNNTIQLKVPYSYINGNLGSASGLGDITISLSQRLISRPKLALSLTLGGKIATGKSDLEKDNRSLPMPYQVSLGTHDAIIGTALQYGKWNFGAGFQGVLADHNNNRFLRSGWVDNLDAQKYFESNRLRRGNDALLRVERGFHLKRFDFSVGLLGLYRIQKDKITLETSEEKQVRVQGSEGLTLNLTGGINYLVSPRSTLILSFGTPLIVREVRPDGLTRSVVVNFSYGIRFGKK